MNYLLACHTDTGIRKETNQDSLLMKRAICDGEQLVLAVMCDGMGGLEKGELASASLVKAFSKWFEQELPDLMSSTQLETEILKSWDHLIKQMNQKISDYGRNHGLKLGTTLTAMLFIGKVYYIAHVGDSRAYELTDTIYQLTKDQTLVQREVDQGKLTPEQAETDSRRSVLLQCVGALDEVEPVYIKGEIRQDAVYMLCCDGFRHVLSGNEMYQAFHPASLLDESTMESRCRQLVELNKERGELDNISVLVIRTWQGEE
ncbi:MAG: serine/threonine-protein phosphatase [Lachnospiraceae bacterium]|nr:serine/threonine-protein phosphatase [Lachnospiraceae bacterium]